MGAALLVPGAALLGGSSKALAAKGRQRLNPGDVAILQLLAAAKLIEADLWQQYKELGGVDAPDSGYKAGLVILDGDQPQYIADNIRPTGPGQLDATGVINRFIADGLFRGQPPQFLQLITSLASAANAAEEKSVIDRTS